MLPFFHPPSSIAAPIASPSDPLPSASSVAGSQLSLDPSFTLGSSPTPSRYQTRGKKRSHQVKAISSAAVDPSLHSSAGTAYSPPPTSLPPICTHHRRIARIRPSGPVSPNPSASSSPLARLTPTPTAEGEDVVSCSPARRTRAISGGSINAAGIVGFLLSDNDAGPSLMSGKDQSSPSEVEDDVEEDVARFAPVLRTGVLSDTGLRKPSRSEKSPLHRVFAESRSTSVPTSLIYPPDVASSTHPANPAEYLIRRITEPTPAVHHRHRLLGLEEKDRTELDKVFALGYGRGLGAKLGGERRRRGSALSRMMDEDGDLEESGDGEEELGEGMDVDDVGSV